MSKVLDTVRNNDQVKLVFCKSQTKSDYRKNRGVVLAQYGNKCSVCGYSRSTRALHFHHLNPDTKVASVSSMYSNLELALIEAEKCVLLCSNCHAEAEDSLQAQKLLDYLDTSEMIL